MRKSAEILKLSPAALSKAMKTLEDELQMKLFLTEGRGIVLSDQGRQILPQIKKLIEDWNQISNYNLIKKSQKPILKIASYEVFNTHFLAKLMASEFPDYELEAYDMSSGAKEESVASRLVDVALTVAPSSHTDLDFLKIGRIEMGLYSSNKEFDKLTIKDLPFVAPLAPLQGKATRVHGLDGWPERKYPRYMKYKVDLMESALSLCRHGLAVGYFSTFLIRLHNEAFKENYQLHRLHHVNHLKESFLDLYLIKRKSQEEDKVIKKLCRSIRKYIS